MLRTEMRNERSRHIDKMDTLDMVKLINSEDRKVIDAVEAVLPQVAEAADAIAASFDRGGRLFYIGAGTSGRLGVIDAVECRPTYGVSDELVQALIAGGEKTMLRASENEEDNPNAGAEELIKRGINSNDIVVGISAAGGAAYVIGALNLAKEKGCTTVAISCNPGCPLDKLADISICPDTGAEVITGSTRMKAGTSQKLILNMLSTCAMVKTGKVCENLMINLKPTNIKLRQRMIRIVTELTEYDEATAERELERCDWDIRTVLDQAK